MSPSQPSEFNRVYSLPGEMVNMSAAIIVNSTRIRNGESSVNGRGSVQEGGWPMSVYSQEHLVLTAVVLGVFILFCVIGNSFVIAAVQLERALHSVANYLILSLAVTDLLVALLVMPLSIVSEISQAWFLPPELCDLWICSDVLCCTASILHLVAIAMDRYWAVTSIDYIRRRSPRRMLTMIGLVWSAALIISVPAVFGWRDPDDDPELTGKCLISQDKSYTVFSTVAAFYLPMLVMIGLYLRIYQVARSRIRQDKFSKSRSRCPPEEITLSVTTRVGEGEYNEEAASFVENNDGAASFVEYNDGATSSRPLVVKQPNRMSLQCQISNPTISPERVIIQEGVATDETAASISNSPQRQLRLTDSPSTRRYGQLANTPTINDGQISGVQQHGTETSKQLSPVKTVVQTYPTAHYLKLRSREKLLLKRERKATRTLAIITGAFIACWLPFFIVALIGPFIHQSSHIPVFLRSCVLWLGYFNSLLNPIIYTIFSPEFRCAFQKILFGKYRRKY